MKRIAHFCQKCRAANEPGEQNCAKCGTRLMIITHPKPQEMENEIIPSYYEDHLLERISLLEFRVSQLAEQLAMGYEFISRQAKTSEKDHLLMQSFFESLDQINPKLADIFAKEFSESYSEKKRENRSENQKKMILDRIISAGASTNEKLFSHLVKEGIEQLEQNEEKLAFKTLERAVLLSPENLPLLLFASKNLFRARNYEAARRHLKTAFKISPQNIEVLMLFGAIYADEGKAEKARKYLSVLANDPHGEFFADYIWGMLASFEENWKEALIAFTECAKQKETVEISYLIGCVYSQLEIYENALSAFQKALSINPVSADVWHMQGIVYGILGEKELSDHSIKTALQTQESGAACFKLKNKKRAQKTDKALAFLHFDENKNRLLTGGSLRMTKFLENQIFDQ